KESETSSEETTNDEIVPLSDNTNQTLSNVSTSSTNNRAPVRDYLLSIPDGEFTKIKQLVDQQSFLLAENTEFINFLHELNLRYKPYVAKQS
ncbi:10818_t:CDS:2, partial [Racocetra persica]